MSGTPSDLQGLAMSPCNIRFSPLAKQDLDGIHGYISNSLGSPIAGNNTVERKLDSIENLRRYPDSGTPLSSRYQIATNYRYVVAGNYLAFYRHEGNDLFVDRVLYSKSDYLRTLLE